MSVKELLSHTNQCDLLSRTTEVVVYDQGFVEYSQLPQDSFAYILLTKLSQSFEIVKYVSGGFLKFHSEYPALCEDKKRTQTLTALSQPCLSIANQGPTKILPFLYLGSQSDSLNKQLLKVSK